MQFDEAGLITAKVRWFFAAPGAKTFPNGTIFSSSNWGELRGKQLGPGELWDAARPWSNGARPLGLDGQGGFCGPQQWFEEGCPSNAPPVVIRSGRPVCCGPPPVQGSAGIQVGIAGNTVQCHKPSYGTVTYAKFCGGDWIPNLEAFSGELQWPIGPYSGHIPNFVGLLIGPAAGRLCMEGFLLINQTPLQFYYYYPVYPLATNPQIFACNMTELATLCGSTTVYFTFYYPPYAGSSGVKVGLSRRSPTYAGRLGVKPGLHAGSAASVPGRVGIMAGLSSVVPINYQGTEGVAVGLVSALSSQLGGTEGVAVGLVSQQRGRVVGTEGVEAGLYGAEMAMVAGTEGVKAGLASKERATIVGTEGVKSGLSSLLHARLGGTEGVKAGIGASTLRARYKGTEGVKAGVASARRGKVAGTAGVKAGLASELRGKVVGTAGVKAGLASVTFGGVTTTCCTHSAIPNNLHVSLNGGTVVAATYSSVSGGWTFTISGGPSSLLSCSSGTWTLNGNAPHTCIKTVATISLVCNPFDLVIRVTFSGGICSPPAVYTYTFTL